MVFKSGGMAWNIKDKVQVICSNCNKSVLRFPNQAKRAKRFFCNPTCRTEFQRTTHEGKGREHPERRKGSIETCPACGLTFRKVPSKQTQIYCSWTCYSERRTEHVFKGSRSPEQRARISASKKGKSISRHRKPTVVKRCQHCNIEFKLNHRKAEITRSNQHFCTTSCFYEFIRLNPEKNPLFLGGREPYYGPNWKKQARLARARDNYTCRVCGRTEEAEGRALDVHHDVPFRAFGKGRFAEANALSNLVSLCKSCHAKQPKR